jgi:hypothetical protein
MKAMTENSAVRRETCADEGAGADLCAEMTQTGHPFAEGLPLGPQPRLARRWPLMSTSAAAHLACRPGHPRVGGVAPAAARLNR